MLDHITLRVSNYERSKAFYSRALAPLGYKLLRDYENELLAGFGTEDVETKRDFWIKGGGKIGNSSISCLAFRALSKKEVNAFHRAALKAGGKDNGAPGYRQKYYAGYYTSYVLDPDGHNVEAVFDDFSLAKTDE